MYQRLTMRMSRTSPKTLSKIQNNKIYLVKLPKKILPPLFLENKITLRTSSLPLPPSLEKKVWICACMPRFVFIYYVLNIGIHLLFSCNPSVILIFEHYLLKLLHVFPSETRFVLYAYIIFVHFTFFFFHHNNCNYLFIISTCHVISSVIFWRHAQQVAYHVIYKVLVTWHMIFKRNILISFL